MNFELENQEKEMKDNVERRKAFDFALAMVRLYQEHRRKGEFVLSKQLLRSGTSVGANIEEAIAAQSRRDFMSKMSVASKEARESRYWLRLFEMSKLTGLDYAEYLRGVEELILILTAIVKTIREDSKP